MKLRAAAWFVLFALAFLVMASSGPQCARTTEPTIEPTMDTESFLDPCKTQCWITYFTGRLTEGKRYYTALRNCNHDQTCINFEILFHNVIVAELNSDRQDCLLACEHQQGSGAGGQ